RGHRRGGGGGVDETRRAAAPARNADGGGAAAVATGEAAMAHAGLALGLDVGGSSIKHALIDLESGAPCAALASIPTPRPAVPGALVDALARLAAQAPPGAPVGITLPSVIQQGVIHTGA